MIVFAMDSPLVGWDNRVSRMATLGGGHVSWKLDIVKHFLFVIIVDGAFFFIESNFYEEPNSSEIISIRSS